MEIAALVAWVITALGGFYLLAGWLSRGGQKQGSGSRLPVPVIFGNFALAAIGLVVWIVYLLTGNQALTWTALIILAVVAVLGFTMLARWVGARRATVPAGQQSAPAESGFPVAVVAGHGVLAVLTVVLVLLVAVAG